MNRDATSDSKSRSLWGDPEGNNKRGSESTESDALGESPSLPLLIGSTSQSAKVVSPAGAAAFARRAKVGGGETRRDDWGQGGENRQSGSTGAGWFCLHLGDNDNYDSVSDGNTGARRAQHLCRVVDDGPTTFK